MSGSFNEAQQKSRNGGRKKSSYFHQQTYVQILSHDYVGYVIKTLKTVVSALSPASTYRYVNLGKLFAPHAFTSPACLITDSCENEQLTTFKALLTVVPKKRLTRY